MRLRMFAVTLLCVPVCFSAFQAAPTDPQGVAVLAQSLNASGVTNPIRPVQDFVANGSITYFWAGEEVSGPATIRGRGSDQFRLDANLPEGTRSYSASFAGGVLKETDGSVTAIPTHSTLNVGVLTLPYLTLLARVNDPLTTVTSLGVTQVDGRAAYQMRVGRHFADDTPDDTLAKLCVVDYFIDAQTLLLVKTLDMTHPVETVAESCTREIDFQNYQITDGVRVPTLIREKVGGQKTWELRLSNLTFNTGLNDFDFALQ